MAIGNDVMNENLTSELLFWLDRLRALRRAQAPEHIPVEVRSVLLDKALAQLTATPSRISYEGIKAMAALDYWSAAKSSGDAPAS